MMYINYKACSNRISKVRQNFLKERIDIQNEQYEEYIIQNSLKNFEMTCESLDFTLQNGNILNLIDKIKYLLNFKEDISKDIFLSVFFENETSYFLISVLNLEISEQQLNNSLIEAVLSVICNFIYYSNEIAAEFVERNLISKLIEHWGLFSNQIKYDAVKIISNLVSVNEIKEIDLNFEKLFQICEYELFESDDCLIEEAVIHLLVVLSVRNDIAYDIDVKRALYDFFFQMFNSEKVGLFSESLLGIYYIAQTESGCEIILNDEKNRIDCVISRGLNTASEKIEYHSLLVAQIPYYYFKNKRLNIFHQSIPLKKFSYFIVDRDEDIQKATLNIIRMIVDCHPQLIPSLLKNGIYDDQGLLWILKSSPFDLKKSASYIVMGTVEHCNEEDVNYLIEKELIINATEIITSDSHFFNDDNNSVLIIDILLRLLESDVFKNRLITQLIDSGVSDMIFSFESNNEEIDQKFNYLRKLIE